MSSHRLVNNVLMSNNVFFIIICGTAKETHCSLDLSTKLATLNLKLDQVKSIYMQIMEYSSTQ